MWMKKTILIALFLSLAGFVQAQVIPTKTTALESYDMPGYFLVCTTSSGAVRLVQGGNLTPEGQWNVVTGLAGTGAVSFMPVALADHYMRHRSFVCYCDPAATDNLYLNDASFTPVPGLADPSDPTLVSFESVNYPGYYITHTDALGLNIINNPTNLGAATFRFPEMHPELATDPVPDDEETDVFREPSLNWTPGKFAVAHNVYLGTNLNDVNDADTGSPLLVSQAQDANSYSIADRLEFSQTYFWRVDEINAPPDNTVFKGKVWSFTVEPFVYPIPAANIIPTASGQSEGQGPEKTIDGSGLDENDLHSINSADMWLSSAGDPGSAWIQYEFDKPYKLYEMLIWNYNGDTILSLYGIKEVTIEYSVDGVTWTQANVSELAQASGAAGYAANTSAPFDGAEVKYVKVTANNNWIGGTGIFNKFGLSEVRFMYIPVSARKPSPESGATDVVIDTALSWRPGREATEHNVYLDKDQQAVTDRTTAVVTVPQASYGPLSLDLDSTYYWSVDEVNSGEITPIWQGNTWSFSTAAYLVVDDFESYNDIPAGEEGSNLVYLTWMDGYVEPPDVRTNGSTMGYVISFQPSMESEIVYGGSQSAPLFYDNGIVAYSEVTAYMANQPSWASTLPSGPDWSKGSPQALVLWIHGDPGNTGNDQFYVKVGGSKFPYDTDIARPQWEPVIVDLTGVNLNNVSSLSIGLERTGGSGGSGMILLDEIRLYGVAPQPPEEIWLEAEAADSIEAPMMIYDDLNASGGKYIAVESGTNSTGNPPSTGVARYTITVQGGVYKIGGRVIAPTADDDSFWVQIPGAVTQTVNHSSGWVQWNNIAGGGDWHWDIVHSSQDNNTEVEWTMGAGTYTLEIAYREDGALLDAITITRID